jgi:hypothetical protein
MQQRPTKPAVTGTDVLELILIDARAEAYERATDETRPLAERHDAAVEAMTYHRVWTIARHSLAAVV